MFLWLFLILPTIRRKTMKGSMLHPTHSTTTHSYVTSPKTRKMLQSCYHHVKNFQRPKECERGWHQVQRTIMWPISQVIRKFRVCPIEKLKPVLADLYRMTSKACLSLHPFPSVNQLYSTLMLHTNKKQHQQVTLGIVGI